MEPGRSIIGNAGVLLTRVEYIKQTHHKNFAIVDAGMNDLLRPALYNAWQTILPIIQHQAETKACHYFYLKYKQSRYPPPIKPNHCL